MCFYSGRTPYLPARFLCWTNLFMRGFIQKIFLHSADRSLSEKGSQEGENHPQKPLRGFPPLVLFFYHVFLFIEKKNRKTVSISLSKQPPSVYSFQRKDKLKNKFTLALSKQHIFPQNPLEYHPRAVLILPGGFNFLRRNRGADAYHSPTEQAAAKVLGFDKHG